MAKYLILFILLSLSACSKKTSIILKAENVENLSDKSKIFINGFQVGHIKKLSLNSSGFIIIDAELSSETTLPEDSKFKIEDAGLIGPKIINIKMGNSKKFISKKDTITITTDQSILKTYNANIVNKIINKLTQQKIVILLKMNLVSSRKELKILQRDN